MTKLRRQKIGLVELLKAPLSDLETLRRARLCLNWLGVKGDDVICDIGCGPGLTSLILSKRCERVIAIDVSEPLIDFLRARPHPDNVEFYVLDATKSPPRDFGSRFDKCICTDVLEHVDDSQGLLRFISYILKSGGRSVISCPVNNPHHGMDYLTLLNLVSKSDLMADVKVIELDRFGSLLSWVPAKFRKILRIPDSRSNALIFNKTVGFQMLQRPKSIHYLYKFAIASLFKIHEDPFYESESGGRALIIAEKI